MSSASILIRLAQGQGVPSIVIAAYRMFVATAALTVIMGRQRAWRAYAKLSKSDVVLILLSGILLGLHFASWITSLELTTVVNSVVLVTTTPVWVAFASPIFLGEKTSKWTWMGIVITLVGGVLITFAGNRGTGLENSILGDALALLGAIFAAGYFLIGRGVRQKLDLAAYIWLVYGVAAAVLLVWVAVTRQNLLNYGLLAFIWLIALGLVPQLIGHSAANYAVRSLSAAFVTVAILGESVGSTILAAIILKEIPVVLQIVGVVIIFLGIVLASQAERIDNKRVSKLTPTSTAVDSDG